MNDTLVGKRALVTGASSGIGLATARLFAENGATVVGLAKQWPEKPEFMECVTGDVTSDSDVAEAIGHAAGGSGLDILVANAGVAPQDEDWHTGTPDTWREVFEVNLLGVMRCLQAAGKDMIRNGRHGRMVATASVAGLRPFAEGASYSASKAGVISVVQSAALAFGEYGIAVNAIAPGHVADTQLYREFTEHETGQGDRSTDQLLSDLGAVVPLGRLGTARDLAAAMMFLASDAAGYVSGATLCVDGGLLRVWPRDV